MDTKPLTRFAPAKERIGPILAILARLHPTATVALDHANPLQLLVATILSAQCTDKRVNLVTPALFARYGTIADYANANPAELEEYVSSINFYRNKAKNIQECCRQLVERFNGEVPATLDELVTLPGIGRKTANVILGNAFETPGITVDTHVGRVSRRLGLTRHTDPEKVEQVLMKLVPRREWINFSHRVILHGRQVCHARKPDCDGCALNSLCPRIGVEKTNASQKTRNDGESP